MERNNYRKVEYEEWDAKMNNLEVLYTTIQWLKMNTRKYLNADI